LSRERVRRTQLVLGIIHRYYPKAVMSARTVTAST